MKILVTGGAGFIGSHISDAFLATEHEVAIVDDLSSGRREQVPVGARFHRLDIRSPRLEEIFEQERPEIVCHQAARANLRESLQEPILYSDVNVLGSLNILQCCRGYQVRKVIYASTGGACYGEPRFLPVTEEHPVNPLDPYGASKHHVEHYLYVYKENFHLDYTVLRYPNVYGPRQDPFGEAGVVAIFARQMLDGDQVLINGTGEQERDFVYVSDVVRANVLALNRGSGEILNIGSGKGTSVNQVFAKLAKLSGYSRQPLHGSAKLGEVSKTYLDATRAKQTIGWEPKMRLEDGLATTLDFLRSESR
jgi:UDP-glucose 4-epimerase